MSILKEYREGKAAIHNVDCTVNELNAVLRYFNPSCEKAHGNTNYYMIDGYLSSQWGAGIHISKGMKHYPVKDFLKAIEEEKIKEITLDDVKEMMKDIELSEPMEDSPFELSIKQWGETMTIKVDSSDITLYKVKEMVTKLLVGSGWSEKNVKSVFGDGKDV